MNRCPACRSMLRFFAIRPTWVRRPKAWERWDHCLCGTFVVSDGSGHISAITRQEPGGDYFRAEP